MTRRRSDRIYGVTGHPMIEALPLVVAFLTGTVGGILLKLGGASPLISAGFAALILVSYAVIAYVVTPLRVDSETIGDNSYYLGFLFTLTSLAVTLYFVIGAGPDQADLIPEIISGFGVALSSTIVGVFLRVLMMQLKVDVEMRERRVRLELDEYARRFRTELGISLDKVKGFSTESLQQAREREERMRIACDALMADMQADLLKSAGEFGPALRESVKLQTEAAFAEIRKALGEASGRAAIELRQSMEALSSITRETAANNKEIADDTAKAVGRIRDAAVSMADGAELTAAKLTAAERMAWDFTEAMTKRLEIETQSMASALTAARSRLDKATTDFVAVTDRAGPAMSAAAHRFEEVLGQSTKTFADASERGGAGIEAATVRMERAIDASARKLTHGSRELSD